MFLKMVKGATVAECYPAEAGNSKLGVAFLAGRSCKTNTYPHVLYDAAFGNYRNKDRSCFAYSSALPLKKFFNPADINGKWSDPASKSSPGNISSSKT